MPAAPALTLMICSQDFPVYIMVFMHLRIWDTGFGKNTYTPYRMGHLVCGAAGIGQKQCCPGRC